MWGIKEKVYLIFAWYPTYCRCCNGFIWLWFYYGMPEIVRAVYNYGPHANEHHCISCHKELIKGNGKCMFCRL